ncbi:MAG: hypothetical protein ACQERC_11765 [Bacteroidota bacterium]
MTDYRIEIYRADQHPERNAVFIREHANVLKDYGVTMITSFKEQKWVHQSSVYCLVAYTPSDEMIGGIRVHIADFITPLPLETALHKMDKGIYDLVKSYASEGVGELCGLWNAKKVAGVGISFVLTRAAVAVMPQLQFNVLMGICAEYSLNMFRNVGFEIDNTLGDNGEFPYPTTDYITRVVGILKSNSLATAHPLDRKKILDLRKTPIQKRTEQGKKGGFTVHYNLRITPEGAKKDRNKL